MKKRLEKMIATVTAGTARDQQALTGYREAIEHLEAKIRAEALATTVLEALSDSGRPYSRARKDHVFVHDGRGRVVLSELLEPGVTPEYRIGSVNEVANGPQCNKCRCPIIRIEHEHVVVDVPRSTTTTRLLLCINCPRVEPDPTERVAPASERGERTTNVAHPH